jgi:hypothetical protein
MADKIPGSVRVLSEFLRKLIALLRKIAANETQFHALQAELGLPPTEYNADSIRQVSDKLTEIDGKLAAGDNQSDEDFSADAEIIDLVVRGKAFVQIVEVAFSGDRYNGDARTAVDISIELFGVLSTEWMRVHVPIAWASMRLVMFGYERVEELPRLDPFTIFDRLTGNRTRTRQNSFEALDIIGGFGIPAVVVALNVLIDYFSEMKPEELAALPDGKKYYTSDIDFKLGWEPNPDTDPAVQELLARSVTLAIKGTQKTKGSNAATGISVDVSAVHFHDEVEGPGFLIRLGGDVGETFDLDPKGNVKRNAEFALVGGGGLDLWWTEKFLRVVGAADSNLSFSAKYTATGTEDAPAFRLGKPGKSRFDIVGYGFSGGLSRHDQSVGLSINGGKLLLFVEDLLPGELADVFKAMKAEKFEAKVEGALKLAAEKGLTFEGEAGLKIRVASNLNLDAARVDYVDLELGLKNTDLQLSIGAAARFSIGAFTASMDRFGLAVTPLKGDIEFLPPKGIGLRIDAKVVKGGGYLMLDYEAKEFAGALELAVGVFSVKAIAILSAGGPGSDAKFALFVLLYMRWPGGLELGLRFTLNAVGGMIGINHDFSEQALINALPSGAMDDVLFPDDPVGDAPRIIASLKTIFPVKGDAYTIGIMAEVGWGSDYFCSLRLGIIVPFGKDAGPDDGFEYIYILGRMAVICFKDVPKAVRLQLMCDFIGHVGVGKSGINVGIYARLRDSRFGPTSIEGAVVFSVRTGPSARFLIAAGGFHPAFKNIPEDLPSPIDRIGTSYDIGVIQAWVRGYFAIASGSLQFGVDIGCRYRLGPIGFTAQLALDALIHLSPFSFEADVRASAALTYRGHELLGVHLSLTIWGPDRWRIKGHGEFTILFWDIDVDVDEAWGDDISVDQVHIQLEPLVRQDLRNTTNWKFTLAGQSDTLVTINMSALPADPKVEVAHPLASMSYTQRRLPFGLNLERVSFCVIDGPTLFPVPTIKTGVGTDVPDVSILYDQFAVPEYLNLTDDQKFSRPSFETLPAGIAVGSSGYVVPDAGHITETPITCELIFSKDNEGVRDIGLDALEKLGISRLAGLEATGKSTLRPLQKKKLGVDPVLTHPPQWVAADRDALRVAGVGLAPAWASNSAAAMTATIGPAFDIVEAYELVT